MSKSCYNCIHKDVCFKREMFLLNNYFLKGRYDEIADVKNHLDIGVSCNDHLTAPVARENAPAD